jgi:hypothetical protein
VNEPLFPRSDLRRLARDVVAELRSAGPKGLPLADLRAALGLPRRARLINDVARTLEAAGILSRTYRCAGSVFRYLRPPTREEMAAPPRVAAPYVPATVLGNVVAVERSETSCITVELRERDGERWVAIVHEIRTLSGDWHPRRSFAVGLDEVDHLVDALVRVAE